MRATRFLIVRSLPFVLLCILCSIPHSVEGLRRIGLRSTLGMGIRWRFEDAQSAAMGTNDMGAPDGKQKSLKDLGIIGSEGEFYFNPTKVAHLDLPSNFIHRFSKVLPIFPYTGLLVPGSTEWLTIVEMRFRQMFTENSRIGVLHYSSANQRIALVGTVAKIKERHFMPDGKILVAVEGIERFFLREVVDDKPYLLAKVSAFADFSENQSDLESLEYQIAYNVRINLEMIQWLFPSRNFSMPHQVADNFPPPLDCFHERQRTFSHCPPEELMRRRSELVFGVINLLQVSPSVKLALLQDPILESRMKQVNKILKTASEFLEKDVIKKQVRSEKEIEHMKLLTRVIMDNEDRAYYHHRLIREEAKDSGYDRGDISPFDGSTNIQPPSNTIAFKSILHNRSVQRPFRM